MPSIDLLSCFDPSRAESRLPARALVPSVIPNGSGMNHLSVWLVMNPMRAETAETTIMPIQNPPRPLLASSRSCSIPFSSLSTLSDSDSTVATSLPYLYGSGNCSCEFKSIFTLPKPLLHLRKDQVRLV